MKKTRGTFFSIAGAVGLLALLGVQTAPAQQSTVYAVVVSTKMFVVGAANPQTGIFYQTTGDDTVWSHTGPRTIRAFDFAVGPGTGGKEMYIASGNGVHGSTDGGESWKITTGWEITEVLSVSADPHNAEAVYIATAYGIFKTADGCETWQEINAGLDRKFTSCVLVDRFTPDVVYCAGEGGAYVSRNGGRSWNRMGLSVGNVRVINQHPRDPQFLVAGTEKNGIYASTNGGRWWEKKEAGVDHETFYTIVFDPNNPDLLYAGGYVTGVYKSVDRGESWKRMNRGLKNLTIHALAVDPHNSNTVYAGGYWGGVSRSDNGAGSWQSAGLPEGQIWNIFIQP
jgi:photosystem II stability/assembly factor-like uncharacterized protein